VQRFLRKWHEIKKAQTNVQILQYSIVEAKMLRGVPLKGETIEAPKKKRITSLNRRMSSQLSAPLINDVRNSPSPTMDESTGEGDREDKYRFKLLRLPLDMKKEIITSDLKQRRRDYIAAQKVYKNKLQQYDRRVQQLLYILQAKSALSGGQIVIDPSSVRDENGDIIEKPKPPYLKVVLSELEMKRLVMVGQKKMKDIEDEVRLKVLSNYVEFSEKQNELDKFKQDWESNVAQGFIELRKELGSFQGAEQLLLAPFENQSTTNSSTRSPVTRSSTSSPANFNALLKPVSNQKKKPPGKLNPTPSTANLQKR